MVMVIVKDSGPFLQRWGNNARRKTVRHGDSETRGKPGKGEEEKRGNWDQHLRHSGQSESDDPESRESTFPPKTVKALTQRAALVRHLVTHSFSEG
jgi:hypothetical protein